MKKELYKQEFLNYWNLEIIGTTEILELRVRDGNE